MLLPILGGILFGLTFVNYNAGWLAFCVILPVLFFIDQAPRRKYSVRKQILLIWAGYLIGFLIVMSWMLTTDERNWAGLSQKVPHIAVVFSWFVSALIFSVGTLFFAITTVKLSKKYLYKPIALLIIPLFWAIGEIVRSLLFSVVWYGAGATIGTHWNFGDLGLALAVTPAIMASRLLGLYGLGFLAVYVNLCLFWLLKKRYAQGFIGLSAPAIAVVLGWAIFSSNGRTAHVAAVQLSGNAQGYSDALMQKVSDTKTPTPAIVIFPEYANLLNSGKDSFNEIMNIVFRGNDGIGVVAESTDHTLELEKQQTDRLYVFDRNGSTLSAQDKNFLIPGGEYMPAILRFGFDITGKDAMVHQFNLARALKKGAEDQKVVDAHGIKIGALACSGIVSPTLYQELAKQHADILVNSASLGIISSRQFLEQTKSLARFNAVANNRPFIQAARNGTSLIVQPSGKFERQPKTETIDYLESSVTIPHDMTAYSRFNEVFIMLACATAACIGISSLIKKRKQS